MYQKKHIIWPLTDQNGEKRILAADPIDWGRRLTLSVLLRMVHMPRSLGMEANTHNIETKSQKGCRKKPEFKTQAAA